MQQLLEIPKSELIADPIPVKVTSAMYHRLTTDPRPDLFDTKLWAILLPRIVHQKDFKIKLHHAALETLHSIRCIGTVLKWNHHVNYKLVPVIDFGNWESQDEWDSMIQYLIPFKDIYRNWFYLIAHEDARQ
ncbi:MAG: hypothetical protein JWM44_2881 [Bacilli bacterium]|nr:hypothetical protein [Bacilli bacterium]